MAKTMTKIGRVRALLNLGLRRISKGWTQRTMHRRVGTKLAYCAVGALQNTKLTTELVDGPDVYIAARKMLQRVVGGDVVNWNDTKGRTQADVINAYKRAIANAKRV